MATHVLWTDLLAAKLIIIRGQLNLLPLNGLKNCHLAHSLIHSRKKQSIFEVDKKVISLILMKNTIEKRDFGPEIVFFTFFRTRMLWGFLNGNIYKHLN